MSCGTVEKVTDEEASYIENEKVEEIFDLFIRWFHMRNSFRDHSRDHSRDHQPIFLSKPEKIQIITLLAKYHVFVTGLGKCFAGYSSRLLLTGSF